jgi:hypothetical protein
MSGEKIIKGTISANGYVPIQDENGRKICEFSTIMNDDPNKSLLSPNLNINLPAGKAGSYGAQNAPQQAPVCTDSEIYQIQDVILKKLNKFNADYSNYVIYNFNKSHQLPGDQTKRLNYTDDKGNVVYYTPDVQHTFDTKYASTPSANSLPSYNDLLASLNTYDMILQANKYYRPDPANPKLQTLSTYYTPGPTPGTNVATPEMKNNNDTVLANRDPNGYLLPKHREILKLRGDLDEKLMEFNNTKNSVFGESKLQMDASIYVTILWTTLASAVVYFTFVHM